MRVKRGDETYFLLCDEYETVESLKGRFLLVLDQLNFQLPKQEEPFTTDDIRFCIKNRVSHPSAFATVTATSIVNCNGKQL